MSSASAPDDPGAALPQASNVSILAAPATPSGSSDGDGGAHLPNRSVGASVNDGVDRDDGSIERMSMPAGAVVRNSDYPWQIFHFAYHPERARVVNRQSITMSVQTLENQTADAQQMEVNFSEFVTHTSKFEDSAGVSIAAGLTFTAGIPFIVTVESHIEITGSYTHTWGEQTSTSRQWSARFPVNVGPGKTYQAISTVSSGTLQVPYTMKLNQPHNPGETKPWMIQDTWSGFTSWELRHRVFNLATGDVVMSF